MQSGSEVYTVPIRRRLVAHTATTAEHSTKTAIVLTFSAVPVLTTRLLILTAGTNAALTIGFRPGWSVMNRAIGGLVL